MYNTSFGVGRLAISNFNNDSEDGYRVLDDLAELFPSGHFPKRLED